MPAAEIIPLNYAPNSADLFSHLIDLPWACLLDSCQPESAQGRYDILTAAPFIKMTTRGGATFIEKQNTKTRKVGQPFTSLKNILSEYVPTRRDVPFCGGALGYFSYDLGRHLERLPDDTCDDIKIPDMCVGIYDWAIVVDHQRKTTQLVAQHFDPKTRDTISSIQNRINKNQHKQFEAFQLEAKFVSNTSKQTYLNSINKIHAYLRAGDCYQVNYSQRFQAPFSGHPWSAYKKLRENNPAPFAGYLNYPEFTLLSSSPERFIECRYHKVESKPIKGTAPRHANPEQDHRLAQQLQASEKDRAENLMIVDLLRNDMGKCCEYGSVTVPKLFELESFPNLHHLVSTVRGQLREDLHAADLLRACFPGGSITGAPKIRAMEIIEELETHRRGLYCGSIAYIDFAGNMDSNIAIRSCVAKDNTLFCSAGGAIVMDSSPEAEYAESLLKLSGIMQAIPAR